MSDMAVMDVKLTPFQETVMLTLFEANYRGLYPDDEQLAAALEVSVDEVREAMCVLVVLGFVEHGDG
jgi:hypothetical protein